MTFRFPCYRTLKQQLGEFDALSECVELATRDLGARAVEEADPKAFLNNLSSLRGVRVNELDLSALRPHVARMYLLTVYQCLEDFLLCIREEHPHGNEWDMDDKKGHQKMDRAKKIATAVGFAPTLAFELCQYYRGVRNATMHPLARAELGSDANDIVIELRRRVAKEESLKTLNAPNAYSVICFDDFVLFSRSTKTLAAELCEATRPTDEELAAIATKKNARLAGKLRESPERLTNAKSGFLQTMYSLSKTEADNIIRGSLA